MEDASGLCVKSDDLYEWAILSAQKYFEAAEDAKNLVRHLLLHCSIGIRIMLFRVWFQLCFIHIPELGPIHIEYHDTPTTIPLPTSTQHVHCNTIFPYICFTLLNTRYQYFISEC